MTDGFCAPEGAPTVKTAFYNRKAGRLAREGAVGATNPLYEHLPRELHRAPHSNLLIKHSRIEFRLPVRDLLEQWRQFFSVNAEGDQDLDAMVNG